MRRARAGGTPKRPFFKNCRKEEAEEPQEQRMAVHAVGSLDGAQRRGAPIGNNATHGARGRAAA